MQTRTPRPSWEDVDTLLVDMDGTLLDLAFDNFCWLELVPLRYARLRGIPESEARRLVALRYARVVGSLPWYCVDHWSRELGLDIKTMKWDHKHLVRYLPGARRFLAAARARGKRLWIVTNAHRETIAVKIAQTGLDARVDDLICSHDLLAPKESPEFWSRLQHRRPFDPRRTMLIEDSVPVLEAATRYGVRHALAIRRPDSRAPPREIVGYPAVDGLADLIDAV